MIIYQMKKPIECYDTDCVGVTGDNIAYTQYFYIKGVSDDSISYTLHLRFADGSVNSITPDNVIPDGEGTEIRWIVKKNDIFKHGYFELQIEGRNKFGLVFQTEIVRLYADESLPVEDREYANPNSETVKLREEAYVALEELKKQQAQIEQNVEKIKQTDLDNKADKSTTLAGYGITDGENIGNKVADKSKITDESTNYPSISYLYEYYYDYSEIDDALSGKLDNTAGSVKTDNIASKAVTNEKIANGAITNFKLAVGAVSGNNIAQNQISTNHLQNGAVTADKLADEVNTIINSKYDSSNVETGSGSLTVYTQSAIDTGLIKSCTFEYQKTGRVVNIFFNIVFNEGSISYMLFTGLPFRGNETGDQNKFIGATNKHLQVEIYPVGSWLALYFNGTKTFTQDEILRGVITLITN
ncbi:MAG: hypothetical protein ACI4G0_08270 [Ruminococcus sp.]